MANVTLVRRDAYLAHVKSGLKQDTLSALHEAPLDLPTLFLDSVLRTILVDLRTRVVLVHGQSGGRRDIRFHPYKRLDNRSQEQKYEPA